MGRDALIRPGFFFQLIREGEEIHQPLGKGGVRLNQKEVINMNKGHKHDFKDALWGLFWVGLIVVPVVYVILQKKKAGDFGDKDP